MKIYKPKATRKDMPAVNSKNEKMTTTIEVNKDLFLKFKALCVLKETKISGEIEKLIERRVNEMSKSRPIKA